jgi:hypothetical protein
MNREQTKSLMLHVNGVFGLRRPPEPEEVDRWHHMLVDVDEIIARRAVRTMAEDDPGHAPTLAKMLSALNRPTDRRPGPVDPPGQTDCGMCDGTGWMLTRDPDENGVDRYAPCAICRPADYETMKQAKARHPASAPMRSLIAEGDAARLAAWKRGPDAYAAVLREQFPKAAALTEDDVARRMARIAALPGYRTHRLPDDDSPPEAS